MGRATEGVRGMTLRADDEVIAAEIAADDADLLVVTENGYGKRTRVSEYPRKGRGGMGVQTIKLAEARGKLAGARVVRDGYQVMLISTAGTVIKMAVEAVKRLGRSTQGVIVMRLREGEIVSTLAPVTESDDEPVALDTVGEPGDPDGNGGLPLTAVVGELFDGSDEVLDGDDDERLDGDPATSDDELDDELE
jgi:DNA gyrase subunit A